MKTKEIKLMGNEQFLKDLKTVREIMVYTNSASYLEVKRKDVLRRAETEKIIYSINENIFVVKRKVMVIR